MSQPGFARLSYRIPIVDFLNNLVSRIAETTAWLNVLLIGIIVAQVVMRYGFNHGLVPLEELMQHFYAVAFIFGLAYAFVALAETCAEQVFQPEKQGCCGFAGEKSFTTPELNACALSRLKQQIPDGCESGYSNSRTCEIGLSKHAGNPFRSILYLVDACFDAADSSRSID